MELFDSFKLTQEMLGRANESYTKHQYRYVHPVEYPTRAIMIDYDKDIYEALRYMGDSNYGQIRLSKSLRLPAGQPIYMSNKTGKFTWRAIGKLIGALAMKQDKYGYCIVKYI